MTREEAVEVLKERYLTCVGIGLDNHANRVNEAIDMAIEALQEAQKHEETLSVGGKKYIEYSRCSECGEMALVRMNFCPNCGADMRGGVERREP